MIVIDLLSQNVIMSHAILFQADAMPYCVSLNLTELTLPPIRLDWTYNIEFVKFGVSYQYIQGRGAKNLAQQDSRIYPLIWFERNLS